MSLFSSARISLLLHIHMDSYLAKRRNKWICALKTALGELKVYGPKGNPDTGPSTTRYTKVPSEVHVPSGGWHLRGNSDMITDPVDAVFGENSKVQMNSPTRGLSEEGLRQRPTGTQVVLMPTPAPVAMPSSSAPSGRPQEMIEMTPRT